MRQSTAAFIVDTGKRILLVQPIRYAQHEWTVPGGGRKPAETYEEAVRREIQEETGLSEADITFVGKSKTINRYLFNSDFTRDLRWQGQLKHQFVFRCQPSVTVTVPADEIRAYKWVNIDELSHYLLFKGQLQNAQKVLTEFGLLENATTPKGR